MSIVYAPVFKEVMMQLLMGFQLLARGPIYSRGSEENGIRVPITHSVCRVLSTCITLVFAYVSAQWK